jgi:glycosyltransferase involved in cell wall biosynthesis
VKILHVREIANVAATLVEGLRRLGHEAELNPMRTRRSEGALEVTGVPARFVEARRINSYIHRSSFDVIHLHWAYMGWMGILGNYPYFLHCHGSDLRRNLGWPFLNWLTRRALEKAQRVFYSTPDLRRSATQVRKDAVFIPNPIDLNRFRPAEASNGKNVRILLMSRFEAVKGPEKALAMIRELRRREPRVQVDAFDWGIARSRFADPALMNLIPTVPYASMPELLSRYDILIGQFKLGIVSMSELEAMACGKPVLCFFNYPEAYDEPPPVFSTRDHREGADIISRLVEDNQLRKEAGEKGRAWVEQHHDFVRVAKLVEGHYQEILEN